MIAVRQALIAAALCVLLAGCSGAKAAPSAPSQARGSTAGTDSAALPASPRRVALPAGSSRARRLAIAAEAQVGKTVNYDPAYVDLAYPGGDVPIDRGVCSDVVVRAFRAMHVDLQVKVHEDMAANFDAYPKKWGLRAPDSNIDHRRVPNLRTYFKRRGWSASITQRALDYRPGDIVTWDLSGLSHIGIVSTMPAPDGSRYCVVHNVGAGTRIEDVLFANPITGHYRPM